MAGLVKGFAKKSTGIRPLYFTFFKQNDATGIQSDTLATEEQADAPSSGSVVRTDGGERPLLTIESVHEYTQLLNSGKLPADFVAYDKIDAIGAFESFNVLSDAYNSDYSSYMYRLQEFFLIFPETA